MTTTSEINRIVKDRDLNQFHLLIASLLGSLGQTGSTQGALNLLMARSMDDFLIPFFEGQDTIGALKNQVAAAPSLSAQMEIIVKYVNEIFSLAGQMTVEPGSDASEATVVIKSSGCRYCPIGVGRAKIDGSNTYCPIPTMVEKSASYFRSPKPPVKLQLFREKATTRVLQKRDGHCYISYRDEE
ncbi:MAG: hypothetical protein JXR76_24735 [Deltaproteobacteria bacterium]|nr:hypothetical protein [Deltaproteobacteria bacterium]